MAECGYPRDKKDDQRVPRHSGLCNHHSQVQWKRESMETCTVMNSLGYGSHIRQARRDAYREIERITTAMAGGGATVIFTGSKAEGLTSYFESDTDVIIVRKDVTCVEHDVNSHTLPRGVTVFTLNTAMCYHGHCRLFLEERPGVIIHPNIRNAMCADENGRALLSSDLYVNEIDPLANIPYFVRHQRAGPAIPMSLRGVFHIDVVRSFHCNCPSILRKWAERRRHWQPPDVVLKVVSMGAFVTPVGFKGSEYKHVEWRICFNTGENYLVSCLNDTQVYIYVLLKMIKKKVLKPLKKELTSYTAKNIVLWLAENNPQEMFNERTLLHWLREGLEQLRSVILTEHLSYYMIPERNLVAACGLYEQQKRTWITILTDMIDEGPRALLRIPKIRQAIISHPEPFAWYSKKRMELELLAIKYRVRTSQCLDKNHMVNESDTMKRAIRSRIGEILTELYQRMRRERSRVVDLLDIYDYILM